MKKFLAILLAMAVVFSLVACGGNTNAPSDAGTTAVSDHSDQNYIFVSCLNNLEYMNDHKLGWEVAAKELGVSIEYFGPGDNNVEEQAAAFEQAIAKKPAGIVTLPLDPAIAELADKATEAGIPVVFVDADYPSCARAAFCGTGNVAAGVTGGKALAEMLGGKGKIAVLTSPGSSNLEERLAGYQQVIAEYPDMEIVAIGDNNSDYTTSVTVASTLLQAHPDLDAFVCLDSTGGQGAATALKELDLDGKVKIIAMDKDAETLAAISEGSITATLAQNTALMPYYALQILYSLNNNTDGLGFTDEMGIVAAPGNVDTGCYLIDASNVEFFYKG